MAVIRLFHLMDQDDSNSVSLTELSHIQSFFKKTGHQDLSTSFDVIDEDGNGQISLHELLQCCFPLATVQQLDEMLKLAKAGSITKYVNGQVSDPVADQSESSLPLDELTEMFRLFDVNGDGYVTMEEAMSAVRAKGPDSAGYEPKFAECSSWRWSSGLTREDIESCFAEYDSNGDKVLDFAEFVQLMRISYQP
ncbi:TPA: hypothetical protein N0F65_000727 [Lagenidium giganteum]|uniref:EF-hand domain-containing protein n=1 Tax=Lagenidium giganteum TaxID=4803 RepID=A0AAV2ZKM8_9STRA|nr:TPA: hypothetical protein N0F65_000727 [Lagenidium giganteum]